MKPIVLTADGDEIRAFVQESWSTIPNAVETDVWTLGGIHYHCGGVFTWRKVTETHFALLCPLCFLRVVFPETVGTYQDLRAHFRDFNNPEETRFNRPDPL